MTATRLALGAIIVAALILAAVLAQGIGEAFGFGLREYLVR